MKLPFLKKIRLSLLLLMWLCLSGCSAFQSVENLYHLPQQSLEHEQLISEISSVRSSLEQANPGVEYANILSGDNTSTIQLQNLGTSLEVDTAITFFRVPNAENPIKIFIFTVDLEGNFIPSCIIEGQGSSILSVDFADLNGIGKKEILVNWQNNQLGVYSLDYAPLFTADPSTSLVSQIPEATQLLTTAHSNFALIDFNKDGLTDLSVIRLDTAGGNSYVELFQWTDGALITHSIAQLSSGITSLSNVRTNYVTGNVPALYISANLVDNARTTDILILNGDRLANLTLDVESGISTETLREYWDIGATDINNDNILEIPNPLPLPSYSEDPEVIAPTSFWLIDWTQYNSRGTSAYVFTTYHNVADSWYLIIPNHWRDQISITREDSITGQRTVIFSKWNDDNTPPTPFLAIYKLTGPNRDTRAVLPGRFELGGDSTTIYAAALMDDSWDSGITEQDIVQSFFPIISSWS